MSRGYLEPATAGTIHVIDQQGTAHAYIVTGATTFVGDTHAHGSNHDTGVTTAFGLPSSAR
jgi:hypothetical protein